MSRPRNIYNRERWYLPRTHSYYNLGYCFKRNNRVHTCIAGDKKQTTDLNWISSLKIEALYLLERRIQSHFFSKGKENILSLQDLIAKYQELHFPNMSHANRSKHFQAFKHFLSKNMPLDAEIIRTHLNQKIISSELNKNSIHHLLVIVNRIFNFAVEENYIDRNPLLKAMFPKVVKPEYKKITDEIINKVLGYFKDNKRMFLLIKLIRLTGMRIQEAVNLRLSDIEPTKIKIQGKGNRPRQFTLIPFPDLQNIVEETTELCRKSNFGNDRLLGYINCKTPQQHLRNAFKELSKKKQHKDIYVSGRLFHSIRKLRENEMIYDNRFDANIVAQMLGHTPVIQHRHYEEELSADRQAELLMKR